MISNSFSGTSTSLGATSSPHDKTPDQLPLAKKHKVFTFNRECKICEEDTKVSTFLSCCNNNSCNTCLKRQFSTYLANRLRCSFCRAVIPYTVRQKLSEQDEFRRFSHKQWLTADESDLFKRIAQHENITLESLAGKVIDFNAQDKDGDSFLAAACRTDPVSADTVETLIKSGVSPDADSEESPLRCSLEARPFVPKVTDLLLNEGSADPNKVDSYGLRPLHIASSTGNSEGLQKLLDFGASPDLKDRALGRIPLHYARNPHIAQLLLDKQKEKNIDICSKDGCTPFLLSAHNINLNMIRYWHRQGADTRAKTCDGDSALVLLLKSSKKSKVDWHIFARCFEYLFQFSLDQSEVTFALDEALKNKHYDILETIVKSDNPNHKEAIKEALEKPATQELIGNSTPWVFALFVEAGFFVKA